MDPQGPIFKLADQLDALEPIKPPRQALSTQ
jgi:hypothetical protein